MEKAGMMLSWKTHAANAGRKSGGWGKQNEEIKDDSQNFSSSCQGDDNAPPTLQSKAKTGEAGLV